MRTPVRSSRGAPLHWLCADSARYSKFVFQPCELSFDRGELIANLLASLERRPGSLHSCTVS